MTEIRFTPRERKSQLGELLVASGSITRDQLENALARQKTQKIPIGQLLVKLGYLTDDVMRLALSSQLGVPFIDLDKVVIDRSLARAVNRTFARRHLLLPVAQAGRTLTIAMDDPTKAAVVDDIARLTGQSITVVTSSSRGIQRALRRLYDDEEGEDAGLVLGESAPEAPAPVAPLDEQTIRRADELFQYVLGRAIDNRCSDIHLEMLPGGLQVRFRIDGVLRPSEFGLTQQAIDKSAREIISRIKILSQLDISERRRPQDGSFQVSVDRKGAKSSVDLRVSTIPSLTGESVVIRILDRGRAPKGLDALNLEPAMRDRIHQALSRTAGIFLVTGPTGAGKSTTLYACLMHLNRPEIRILTAEDPVEYVYPELSQSEVNAEIGNTFAAFLRAFLRHDPEVMMVGEIRDEETAEMAFRAAQTGHLLLSTLHTNSAIEALPRLMDLGVDSSLIASSLIGVMSQRLAREVCPHCRKPDEPAPEVVAEFFGGGRPDVELVKGAGCDQCNYIGYQGRLLVADLWVPDPADQLLIMRQAGFEDIKASSARTTISMAESAWNRLANGSTTLEELIRVLPYSAVVEFRERAAARAAR
ncbi:MAG TPA: GspE/PulE family protein [Vicinamibacterales bacterium]|nr:GspE/PulE family protein [Vicinamibacterales bacterium]